MAPAGTGLRRLTYSPEHCIVEPLDTSLSCGGLKRPPPAGVGGSLGAPPSSSGRRRRPLHWGPLALIRILGSTKYNSYFQVLLSFRFQYVF